MVPSGPRVILSIVCMDHHNVEGGNLQNSGAAGEGGWGAGGAESKDSHTPRD